MGGNVWERCDDLWKKYTGEDEVNPRGEHIAYLDTDPEGFVLRGGSFANMPQYIRSVFRTYDEHGVDVSIGFRVCRRAED